MERGATCTMEREEEHIQNDLDDQTNVRVFNRVYSPASDAR